MRELLHGRIERRSYCVLLRNLHALYAALEAALRANSAHACIAPIYFPKLLRTDVLAADLRDLHGDRWIDDLDLAPTTLHYADRLREIQVTSPHLLVAHAYVRYLGDLSGGQILSHIVRRSLPSPQAQTRFLDFGAPEEVATLTREFRSGLDAIALDARCLGEIVAEAQLAFVMHARLFEELLLAGRAPAVARSVADRKRPDLSI